MEVIKRPLSGKNNELVSGNLSREVSHCCPPRVKTYISGESPSTPYYVLPEFYQSVVDGEMYLLEANSLRWWKTSGLDECTKKREELNKLGRVQRPMAQRLSESGFHGVTFNITHACNLRCTYCYIQNNVPDSNKVVSLDIAKKCLLRYGKDTFGVNFMGGEPTLCMDRIKEIVDFSRRIFRKPRFNIVTNGTLLNKPFVGGKTVAEYLDSENFSMTISLDGPEPVHNKYRVRADGKGSFSDVLAGLQHIRGTPLGKRAYLRGTVSSEVLKSEFRFKDRLAYLNALVSEGYGAGVSLEFVDLSESNCKNDIEVTLGDVDTTLNEWRTQILEGAKWYVTEINLGHKPSWFLMNTYLTRLQTRRPTINYCGAGSGSFTCGPDGTLYACHHIENMEMGSVTAGIDPERHETLFADSRIYRRPLCMKCPIRYLCGGGCRAASLHFYKDVTKPVEAICKLHRVMVECAMYVLSHCDVTQILERSKQPGSK